MHFKTRSSNPTISVIDYSDLGFICILVLVNWDLIGFLLEKKKIENKPSFGNHIRNITLVLSITPVKGIKVLNLNELMDVFPQLISKSCDNIDSVHPR